MSLVSIALSVVAVIIYAVDIDKHHNVTCPGETQSSCTDQHFAMVGVTFISSLWALLCLFSVYLQLFSVFLLCCVLLYSLHYYVQTRVDMSVQFYA